MTEEEKRKKKEERDEHYRRLAVFLFLTDTSSEDRKKREQEEKERLEKEKLEAQNNTQPVSDAEFLFLMGIIAIVIAIVFIVLIIEYKQIFIPIGMAILALLDIYWYASSKNGWVPTLVNLIMLVVILMMKG